MEESDNKNEKTDSDPKLSEDMEDELDDLKNLDNATSKTESLYF